MSSSSLCTMHIEKIELFFFCYLLLLIVFAYCCVIYSTESVIFVVMNIFCTLFSTVIYVVAVYITFYKFKNEEDVSRLVL